MVFLYASNNSPWRYIRIDPKIKFAGGNLEHHDKYLLVALVFGEDITEEYVEGVEWVMSAIKVQTPEMWEAAGEFLLSYGTKHFDTWGNHLISVGSKMRNKGYKKTKKIVPFYDSRDAGKKFKMLLRGQV